MANSYERVTSDNYALTIAQQRYRQGEFLRRNHHLISPWMYTPEQIKARNHALFLMHFDMAPRPKKMGEGQIAMSEPNDPTSFTPYQPPHENVISVPMAPLADGEMVIDELTP